MQSNAYTQLHAVCMRVYYSVIPVKITSAIWQTCVSLISFSRTFLFFVFFSNSGSEHFAFVVFVCVKKHSVFTLDLWTWHPAMFLCVGYRCFWRSFSVIHFVKRCSASVCAQHKRHPRAHLIPELKNERTSPSLHNDRAYGNPCSWILDPLASCT